MLRSDRWVSHCTGEVIRHVDHTLNIDIGLDYPRQASFPSRLKGYRMRCLLAKARVCSLSECSFHHSRKAYEDLIDLFHGGWDCVGMSLPMVESAYEAVKSKLETYTINTAQDLLKSSPLPKTRQSLSQEPHDEMLQKLSSALYLSKESFGYYKVGLPFEPRSKIHNFPITNSLTYLKGNTKGLI